MDMFAGCIVTTASRTGALSIVQTLTCQWHPQNAIEKGQGRALQEGTQPRALSIAGSPSGTSAGPLCRCGREG